MITCQEHCSSSLHWAKSWSGLLPRYHPTLTFHDSMGPAMTLAWVSLPVRIGTQLMTGHPSPLDYIRGQVGRPGREKTTAFSQMNHWHHQLLSFLQSTVRACVQERESSCLSLASPELATISGQAVTQLLGIREVWQTFQADQRVSSVREKWELWHDMLWQEIIFALQFAYNHIVVFC